VTVDLHGAMRSFAIGVCAMPTFPDEATGRPHDGLMADSLTSNGLSAATGQPSLITNRCYKEYL
jgi:hypothetical protein